MAILNSLKTEGWKVDEVKLRELRDGDIENISKQELQKLLLDNDIKDFGEAFLSDAIAKSSLKGPFVVQLSKWENVSYPKINEHFQNDGVCSMVLTDGSKSIKAMTTEPLAKISGETPYGAKILITGDVQIEHGIIQLTSKNCNLIGGNVEKLVEKWKTERYSSNKDARNTSEAPKWVSVGKAGGALAANKGKDNFKAMAVAAGETKPVETNLEFEAARQQEIANLQEMRKNVSIPNVKLPPKVNQEIAEAKEDIPSQNNSYNNYERNPPPQMRDKNERGSEIRPNRYENTNRGNYRGRGNNRNDNYRDYNDGNRPDTRKESSRPSTSRPSFRGSSNRDNYEDIRTYTSRPSDIPTLFDHILTQVPNAAIQPSANKQDGVQSNQNRSNNYYDNNSKPRGHQNQPQNFTNNAPTQGFSQMRMSNPPPQNYQNEGHNNFNNRGNYRGRGGGGRGGQGRPFQNNSYGQQRHPHPPPPQQQQSNPYFVPNPNSYPPQQQQQAGYNRPQRHHFPSPGTITAEAFPPLNDDGNNIKRKTWTSSKRN